VSGLREQLRGILPSHALPRRLLVLPAIPLRGPGKPDRVAVADRFAADA
jgi:O-succinylbenzoic acid--CoA ligase